MEIAVPCDRCMMATHSQGVSVQGGEQGSLQLWHLFLKSEILERLAGESATQGGIQ